MTAAEQAQTATRMRPILIMMMGFTIAIAALLVTTATLGASPLTADAAYEIASR